jgi:hypothetical protein
LRGPLRCARAQLAARSDGQRRIVSISALARATLQLPASRARTLRSPSLRTTWPAPRCGTPPTRRVAAPAGGRARLRRNPISTKHKRSGTPPRQADDAPPAPPTALVTASLAAARCQARSARAAAAAPALPPRVPSVASKIATSALRGRGADAAE